MEAEPKRRGRPPGSRNKPHLDRPEETPLVPADRVPAGIDYRYADPDALVARQFTLIDWAQQAMRNEMRRGMQKAGTRLDPQDIETLQKLSTSLIRTIEALKKSADLADEMSKRMTPAQLLEAAIKKIEGQDVATLTATIQRLRAHRRVLAPIGRDARIDDTAADAIASLDEV